MVIVVAASDGAAPATAIAVAAATTPIAITAALVRRRKSRVTLGMAQLPFAVRVWWGERVGRDGRPTRAERQLRWLHCWLEPPLQDQRMIFVPLAVAAPLASTHKP